MKKFICLLIPLLLALGIISYIHSTEKCKDPNYVLNKYFTTGVFNKYRLYDIEDSNLYFSNGTTSFFKIDGISSKFPHDKVNYTVFMEKNDSGIWKIEKVYSDNDIQDK